MSHAVRETPSGAGIEAKRIRGWRYGLGGSGCGLYGPAGPTRGVEFDHLNPSRSWGGNGMNFGGRKAYMKLDDVTN